MKKMTILLMFVLGMAGNLFAFYNEGYTKTDIHKNDWSIFLQISVMLGSIISAFMVCYAVWYFFLRDPFKKNYLTPPTEEKIKEPLKFPKTPNWLTKSTGKISKNI